MVGRGDDDGVDLLLKDFAIIQVGGREAVGALSDGLAARPIDVAHGGDLVVADLVGGIQQAAHASSSSDNADAQGVVGA